MSEINIDSETYEILTKGDLSDPRLIPSGSNYTFYTNVKYRGKSIRVIYKPRIGEQPLHDFVSGSLYKREYASFVLSVALGWRFIPVTVIRDGPYGIGSVQQFIDIEPDSNYFTIAMANTDEIEKIALFDCITNNADRKASHCFLGRDGHIWGIDHGLTFHHIWKLRTVIWDFAEKQISDELIGSMSILLNNLVADTNNKTYQALNGLLTSEELQSLHDRIRHFIDAHAFPSYDPTRRNIPLPWF